MIATQQPPNFASNRPRCSAPGMIASSITKARDLLGKGHFDNAQFEAAIQRCIPSEFLLIASQDDHTQAQEDYFAMDHFQLGPHVPRYVKKANAGAVATCALLQLWYENPDRLVAENCRRGGQQPISVLELSREIRTRVKKATKLDARPTISSSRPLGPPRMETDQYSPFYIVPPGYTGTRRALLIGVISGQGPDLKGPPNDIATIQGFLEKHCGFKRQDITVLQDFFDTRGAIQPTKRNILAGFQKMVQNSAPGDVCFIQFSGHGGRIGNQLYICPSDHHTAGQVSDEMIMKDLIKAMPGNVYTTMLVDCCYSGTVGDLPYVLQYNKTKQEIDAYYDVDMRTEMLRKEAQDAEAYQQYKQARAERRLMGRLADVAAAVADAATLAASSAADAAVYTGKAAATAVTATGTVAANAAVYTGKTAATAVTVTGTAAANAAVYTGKTAATAVTVTGTAAANAAVYTGKTAATAVTATGTAAATAAVYTGKTAANTVAYTGKTAANAAASAATAVTATGTVAASAAVYTGKTAANTVAITGKTAANAAAYTGKTAATAVTATSTAAATAVSMTGKTAASAVAAAGKTSISAVSTVAAGVRNTAGAVNMAAAATASTASGLIGSSSAAAKSGLRNSTGKRGIRKVKSAEPACVGRSRISRSLHFDEEDRKDDVTSPKDVNVPVEANRRSLPARWNTTGKMSSTKPSVPPNQSYDQDDASKSQARKDVEDLRLAFAAMGRKRSVLKKEAAFETALLLPRKDLMTSEEEFYFDDNGDGRSSSYNPYSSESTCSCDNRSSNTSATSLSSFLSCSTDGSSAVCNDNDSRNSSDGKHSTLSSALRRVASSPVSVASGAALTLLRSGTKTPLLSSSSSSAKKAAKAEEAARKATIDSSRREAMKASQQAGGENCYSSEFSNSIGDASSSAPKSNSQKSRQKKGLDLSNPFSALANAAKGAGSTFRRCKTSPVGRKKNLIQSNISTQEDAAVHAGPAVRRGTVVNIALAMEAETAARNEAIERSRQEAAEAREEERRRSSRGRGADRRGTIMNLAMAIEDEEAARNNVVERSREEAARAREEKRGRSKSCPAQPRKSVINLAMKFETQAFDNEAVASLNEVKRGSYSPVRPRKSVMNLAFAFESNKFHANCDEHSLEGSEAEEQLTPFASQSRISLRKSVVNFSLPPDDNEWEEDRKTMEPKEVSQIPNPVASQRRSTAINLMLARDAEEEARKEALECSRREAAEAREAARKSRLAIETTNGDPTQMSSQRRSTAIFLALAQDAEEKARKEAQERSMKEAQEAREAARKARLTSSDQCASSAKPCGRSLRARGSVRNLSMAFETKVFEIKKVLDEESNDPLRHGDSEIYQGDRPMQSFSYQGAEKAADMDYHTNTSPFLMGSSELKLALALELNEFEEEEKRLTVEEEDAHSFTEYNDKAQKRSKREAQDAREAARRARLSKEANPGRPSQKPSQRRNTALNLAMAMEAEEAARKEAQERSQREAQDAREAARLARLAKEANSGRPGQGPSQRRNTALNLAMALEAEEAARLNARERSQREAQEAREAAKKARLVREEMAREPIQGRSQRRSTALNLAMALEADEAARKEAQERSRREAQEAREAARRARVQRGY